MCKLEVLRYFPKSQGYGKSHWTKSRPVCTHLNVCIKMLTQNVTMEIVDLGGKGKLYLSVALRICVTWIMKFFSEINAIMFHLVN